MNTAQIAELLDPFLRAPVAIPDGSCNSELSSPCHSEPAKAGEEPAVLSPARLQSISTYIDILLRWNARINLTAVRDPKEIVTRHFGESLFAARHLYPAGRDRSSGRAALQSVTGQKEIGALAPESVADVGSGAGFPGLPLKLWAPHVSLTLIESNHKKAAFLREVCRALTLTDVNIQNARAETITATFDVVTLRAVERFDAVLAIAAALVAPSGRLALLIGAARETQARTTLPHLAWSTAAPVPQSRSRILLVARRPQ
jgi:16S rRNA (guanine527-N7)-methyltransferase